MAKERGYGVFVTTPPPSETFMIAFTDSLEKAKFLANEWGQIEWTHGTGGVAHYGERVTIEEASRPRRGKTLRFPKWDEIFETGVFEEWLAPELGFHLNKFDEVVGEEREAWNEVWKEAERWLMNRLRMMDIEAYSFQGSEIFAADVKEMIKELKRPDVPEGPREWKPQKRWEQPLARAFQKMLEHNQE